MWSVCAILSLHNVSVLDCLNQLCRRAGIDQPVGAGFAQGQPTALGTDDLAAQFLGFWKNFGDTFNMTGRKIYLTGESYAGVRFLYGDTT